MPCHGGIISGFSLVAFLLGHNPFVVEVLQAVVGLASYCHCGFRLGDEIACRIDDLDARSGIYLAVLGAGHGLHAFRLHEFCLSERRMDMHEGVAGSDHVAFADIYVHYASGELA